MRFTGHTRPLDSYERTKLLRICGGNTHCNAVQRRRCRATAESDHLPVLPITPCLTCRLFLLKRIHGRLLLRLFDYAPRKYFEDRIELNKRTLQLIIRLAVPLKLGLAWLEQIIEGSL